MNAQCPKKWWSTSKSAVLGSTSYLLPLIGVGGGLVWDQSSLGKADLLSNNFDS